ncbi:Acid-sensing ion channel 4-A [Amphibalanus amphitrite]|uniref:Acid-sensing ion channel 4-A n=1 Tax=Amphibalanus amphitrite TaxID=1232801 RepID=A0A6A4VXD6_AMPAM|nr:Acid-sensing ion channel 4-A [Amphibalanus amphitrite]
MVMWLTCVIALSQEMYEGYNFDSVFNQLGNNKSFRELVQSLRRTHGDPSVMQRAFTPSVEEIQQYGIKSAQFITACTLDDAKCSHQDFYQWQSDGYGNCFTFNSGFRYAWNQATGKLEHVKPNKTRTFGSKAGLRVTLNVDAGHYSSLLTPDVGVRVVVHPTDQLPFPEERGFSVVPGFTTAVGISRKRIHRVGPPHGVCREFAEFFGGRELRYTTTACQKRCVEHAIRTKCQCMESVNRDLTMGLTRGLARCNPLVNSTADRCRQQVKSQFSRGKSTCDCPPACLEDRYEKALSMSLPNKHYYRIMRNFTDEFTGTDLCESDNISNSTIRLQVYLEDPSFEYIHESPAYSVESLVSNIGGVMGLCLGLSALTLVEMAEYLVELTVSGWSNWRNRGERAANRSGIKRVEVLPSDPSTGMQCVTIIHTFERPPPTVVEEPPPPKPPQAEREAQTKVSLTFFGKRKLRAKKVADAKKTRSKRAHKRR